MRRLSPSFVSFLSYRGFRVASKVASVTLQELLLDIDAFLLAYPHINFLILLMGMLCSAASAYMEEPDRVLWRGFSKLLLISSLLVMVCQDTLDDFLDLDRRPWA